MGETAPSRLSLLHRAWRLLPRQQRRAAMQFVAVLLAPGIDRTPPSRASGVIVAGELSRASGLGESARLMVTALERLGVPCWPLDVGPLLPAHHTDVPIATGAAPAPGAALVLHVNPPLLPLVLRRLPPGLARGRAVIGCWVWELPVAPAAWRAGARFVHEAWVPSHFTAGAVESLVPGRVRVVPYPIGLCPPVPAPLDRGAFGLPSDAVVVLLSANLASSFVRKNPLAAIDAFRTAFGDRTDRVLVLKIGNPDHFPGDFAQLQAAVAGAANIRLETRVLPPADAHALTASADIILSLHRSEGFGLVPAEAMVLGKPVVATGWSGNMEFMGGDNSVPVPFTLIPVTDPRGVYDIQGARWAEPDIAAAAAALRRLADDPSERASLGQAAFKDLTTRFGGGPLADALRPLGLHPGA